MMDRVQVSFSSEAHRRAKKRAEALGKSFSEYVRQVVVRDLGEDRTDGDVDVLFDLGDLGGSDVANQKHRYIEEAVERQFR